MRGEATDYILVRTKDSLWEKPMRGEATGYDGNPLTEITRSYSMKLNHALYGGAQYESTDFFCSQRAECTFEDAEAVAESLHQFCKRQVLKAANEKIAQLQAERQQRPPR